MDDPVRSSTLATIRRSEQRWWLALAIYIGLGLLGAWRYSGPMPRTLTEPGVSASRALQTLDMLLGSDQKVHRAGTQENELLRVRLLGALDELGAETWSQSFEPPVGRDPVKIGKLQRGEQIERPLVNVVARLPGQSRARPVVLATHYDSCREGPGAGDAGQCVAAVLETLRAIKEQPLKHEVWCLFTDAEEYGLWGAHQFVKKADFPWGQSKPLVVNMDARGNRGAVLLFETSRQNLRSMQIAAGGLASPRVSTSLMADVYRRLPNGTDFTEFLRGGWVGWNLAIVGGADRYHTDEDTLENLSPRSVQHFASHAWGLLKRVDELSDEQLLAIEDSEPAVFFDILGWALFVYPANWNWVHCLIVAALWMVAIGTQRKRSRIGRIVQTLAIAVATVAISAGLGSLVTRGLQASDLLPRRFVLYGDLLCLAYPLVAMVMIGLSARWTLVRVRWSEAMAGLMLIYLVIGIWATWSLPGAVYLFLWPGLALGVCWIVHERLASSDQWSGGLTLLACVLPALFYAPMFVLLAQTLGPRAGLVLAGAAALMLLPTMLAWALPTDQTQAEA